MRVRSCQRIFIIFYYFVEFFMFEIIYILFYVVIQNCVPGEIYFSGAKIVLKILFIILQ